MGKKVEIIGKILLCGALALNGYYILFDPAIKKAYSENFRRLQNKYSFMNFFETAAFDVVDVSRIVIAFIQMLSVFIFVSPSFYLRSSIIFSIILYSAIYNNPILAKNAYQKQIAYIALVKNFSLISAMICYFNPDEPKNLKKNKVE